MEEERLTSKAVIRADEGTAPRVTTFLRSKMEISHFHYSHTTVSITNTMLARRHAGMCACVHDILNNARYTYVCACGC